MQDSINELMDLDPQDKAQLILKLQQSLCFLCEITQLDESLNPMVVANVRMAQLLAGQLKA